MDTSTKTKLHPVIWVAAVSVIVLSLAGVGAITGVIPTVGSHNADPAALQAATSPAPTAASVAAVAAPTEPAALSAEAAKPAAAHSEHKHVVVAASEPARLPPPQAQAAPAPVAPPICKECGTIEAVRQIEVKGEGTGLGAVGGAVVGGLLGNTMGGGHGKGAMTVLGAVGGGLAGNQIEKNVRKQVRYQISVRFDDDTVRTFTQDQQPTWRDGDRVRIVEGKITLLK